MARQFSDFEEFFPWYVGQHSKRATRWMHFAGTHLGAATALTGIATRRPALLAMMWQGRDDELDRIARDALHPSIAA